MEVVVLAGVAGLATLGWQKWVQRRERLQAEAERRRRVWRTEMPLLDAVVLPRRREARTLDVSRMIVIWQSRRD